MDLLEEFMPGMADVLAAQEGALTSVIATLTSQLQFLAATNERQTQRLVQLEAAQNAMRLEVKELQDAPAPAPVVVAPEPDPLIIDALAALSSKMEQLQQDVQQQVAEEMQQALAGFQSPQIVVANDDEGAMLLEERFRLLDEKLSELRSEATERLAEKAKQTEEAVQTQLEQLEKRFDYLSRVKTDVKELVRRADKQDESIEDVRVGIEMLAKSLGSDDVDSETGDEAHADEEEQVEAEVEQEAPPPPRKTALHFIPEIHAESSLKNIVEEAPVGEELPPPQQEEPKEAVAPPEPVEPIVPTEQSVPSPKNSQRSKAMISKYVQRSLRRIRHPPEPITPVPPPDVVEPPPPEVVVEPPIVEEPEVVLETPVVEELPPQQPEGERTTEVAIVPAEPTPRPPTPAPVVGGNEEEKQEEVTTTEEPNETPVGIVETQPEKLPQEYRSQVVTQQKQMDDHVELFRSTSSSNLMRPTVLASVTPARRQRRQTNPRKESNVQLSDRPETAERSRATRKSVSTPPTPVPVVAEPRQPLTKARIRELWMFLLSKLVRLNRLRQLNGINAEKAIFRRQQMSMGSRVKRLEENTTRMDESLAFLEQSVQDNRAAINALDENIVELQPVVGKVEKVEHTQKAQARTIVDMEEKLQEIDVEIQRLRTSGRRNNSVSSNVSSAVTSAISAQLQDVSAKFFSHASAFEASEKLLAQVSQTEIPALHDKLELSLYTLRQEAEQRSNEAAQALQKMVEQLQTAQRILDGNVLVRITDFCNRIYRTLLGMSGAMLQSVELTKAEKSTKTSTRSALDVGIDLLNGIFTQFITNCNTPLSQEADSEIDFLISAAMDFQQQLNKLKGQAVMAKAAAHALDAGGNNDSHGSTASPAVQTSSFEDHLVFITTTKLKEMEGALITREAQKEGNQTPELILYMQDAVVQVRSVLFLLLLHAEAANSRQQVEDLGSSHILVQNKVEEHGFALGHLDSTVALVKMMNTRLDSFMELSFLYAKEEDVKRSIQELLTANNDMRELLTTSLDATRSETLERDGLLGEEMNQLIARVSKKLDKDELLWTQEVLERQVQNVANASLDEHDLIDIHRRLRRKMDKNQLKGLLQNQQGTGPGNMTSIPEGGQKSAPLIGAKCISCQGDLPPTKAMIKSAVRDEVQHELAKSRAQKLPPSSQATFNVSNHRSLESFKKELLLSSLQQQKHANK